MTKRQGNIFKAIKEGFEEVDKMKGYFSNTEIEEIYLEMKEKAYKSELTTIKDLAILVALHRLC